MQINSFTSGGTGFRYRLARRHGLHMGIDVAFGPEDPVLWQLVDTNRDMPWLDLLRPVDCVSTGVLWNIIAVVTNLIGVAAYYHFSKRERRA